MQIVIDIPDECITPDTCFIEWVKAAGDKFDMTILPKRHGRLIILSEDAIKREQISLSFSCQDWISEVGLSNATVAIIEVDGEVVN